MNTGPLPTRVDLEEPPNGDHDSEDNRTLEDTIAGCDPTEDGSDDAIEYADMERQLMHFSNRTYTANSKMIKAIRHLVYVYLQHLPTYQNDPAPVRIAWQLTLLCLLSV